MYVYNVYHVMFDGREEEVKAFSNLSKALTFIEQKAGEISHIKDHGEFTYKQYCSTAEWATEFLRNNDFTHRFYFSKHMPFLVYGYVIHKIKIY